MNDQTMTIVSSTDSPEAVQAALSYGTPDQQPGEAPPATSVVDHSIAPPFSVPSERKPPEGAPKDETDESDDTDTPAPKAADGTTPVPKHRRNDPQKRIDQAVAKQRDAERRAEAIERELQTLRDQLRHVPPPPQPKAEPVAAAPADDAEPTEDQFETYDAYIRAVVDYRADKKAEAAVERRLAAERERIAREDATRVENAAITAHQARFTAAKDRYADFAEVTGQELPVSPVMTDAIVHSEVGADLAYFLGKNPEECTRIAGLPPAKALLAIGRLEAQLDAAPKGPAPVAVRPIETAPSVIRPVTGSAHASVDEDALPMAEYIRRRNAADRAAGRL